MRIGWTVTSTPPPRSSGWLKETTKLDVYAGLSSENSLLVSKRSTGISKLSDPPVTSGSVTPGVTRSPSTATR
jgi:hypothetical protein